MPLAQYDQPFPLTTMSITVRSAAGSPALLSRSVADALTSVDRDVAFTFRPLTDRINASPTQERIVAILSGSFGGLALVLAAPGLHGVTCRKPTADGNRDPK